jgi:thiol-disulfide isomerase/thioredoxin
MRNFLVLLVVALVVAGGYGYNKNPKACQKLGLDVVADTKAIYAPADSTNSVPEVSADTAPAAPPPVPIVAPTPPTPPTPQHYAMGYVAPAPTPPPSSAAPAPATTAIAPSGAPRYVGHLPSFTDYNQGLAAARTNRAPLLILFTGSDWCPYCQKLDQEVISTPNFQSYVAGHFVFVTIDDLRNTPMLSDDKKEITELEQRFQISGFPSMLVLDDNEHVLGGIGGYEPGSGPSAVMSKLDTIAAKFTQ